MISISDLLSQEAKEAETKSIVVEFKLNDDDDDDDFIVDEWNRIRGWR